MKKKTKKKKIIDIIMIIVLCIVYFGLGIIVHEGYLEYQKKQDLYNAAKHNITEYKDILEGQWIRNRTSDWVCVDVKGISYNRCIDVCVHECSHELFAETCEDDPELCFKLLEILKSVDN